MTHSVTSLNYCEIDFQCSGDDGIIWGGQHSSPPRIGEEDFEIIFAVFLVRETYRIGMLSHVIKTDDNSIVVRRS